MKTEDMLRYSWRNLTHRRLRTWLTVLGIVAGIAAVIVLVGLADGLRASIMGELDLFGSQTIIITPMGTSGGASTAFLATAGKLFEKDAKKVATVDGVEYVSEMNQAIVNLKYRKDSISNSVMGIEPDTFLETIGTIEVEEGRWLENGDRHVVVIGHNIAVDSFDEEVRVNSILELSGEKYRVVGILEESGASFAPVDDFIFVSYEDGRDLAGNQLAPRELTTIRIKVADGYDVEKVAEDIEWVLAAAHKVPLDDKDFGVVTAQYITEQIDSIIGMLTLFLGAVSGIALVVGGIGISNTMFMSVMERTNEIGVLKAIGATSIQIERLFMVEAAMIGLAGGVSGVLVGVGVLSLLPLVGLETEVSLLMVAVSFGVAMGVGMIAGTFPAKQAAKVPAMVALRYE